MLPFRTQFAGAMPPPPLPTADSTMSGMSTVPNTPEACRCHEWLNEGLHEDGCPGLEESVLKQPDDAAPVEWLDGLKNALAAQGQDSTFTCGGELPIVLEPNRTQAGDLTPRTEAKVQGQRIITKPVTVRWGAEGCGRVLSLPATDDEGSTALSALIDACVPATFGRSGEDVLDVTYRRAGALSTQDSLTDFCPYQTGIIDIVTQLLLPSVQEELLLPPHGSTMCTKYDIANHYEMEIKNALNDAIFGYPYPGRHPSGERHVHASHLAKILNNLNVPAVDQEELKAMANELDPTWSAWIPYTGLEDAIASRLQQKQRAVDHASGIKRITAGERTRRMLSRGIRAELYKLNVYSGPSGMFKAHVDTPRSETQIGSLVVALPCMFRGGDLVVRHAGEEVRHEWSTSAHDQPKIQWAAFYSDCEHEVLPVTTGHRITLTYNLHLAYGSGLLAGRQLSLKSDSLPLAGKMLDVVEAPDFMPEGGYLGACLNHSYPHTHNRLHRFVPQMLKGSDWALYEAVKAAGLTCVLEHLTEDGLLSDAKNYGTPAALYTLNRLDPADNEHSEGPASNLCGVEVETEEQEKEYSDDDAEYDLEHHVPDKVLQLVGLHASLDEKIAAWHSDDEDEDDLPDHIENMRAKYRSRIKYQVTWIKSMTPWQELSKAYMVYGNQAEMKVAYSSVVMLIKVPSWAARSAAAGDGVDKDTVVGGAN